MVSNFSNERSEEYTSRQKHKLENKINEFLEALGMLNFCKVTESKADDCG